MKSASLILVPILCAPLVCAQHGPGVQQPPYQNHLLDNLQGFWTITGTSGDQPVRGGADAEWVLGHLFLRLHQRLIGGAESVLHVGYDTYDQRLVAIRLDTISARGAETNGFGLQTGNQIQFTFDYPTAPIRETWTWDPQARSWQFLVERKNRRNNTWSMMSNLTLQRFGGGRRGHIGPPPEPPGPETGK